MPNPNSDTRILSPMVTDVIDITSVLDRIRKENKEFNHTRVAEAFEFAKELYGEEMHRTGLTYLDHSIGVLNILLPFEPDEDTIIACILHHAVFKDGLTLTELEERFGPTVRSLISGVHLLSSIEMNQSKGSIDDLRLVLLSVSDDVRTILITLCDRCHLLDHHHGLGKDLARTISNEVLRLYAPVAARLGIYNLKHELERRAFPICYPSDAQRIEEQLQQIREQNGDFLWETTEYLQNSLNSNDIEVLIEHREKQPYSIFRKMTSKGLSSVQDVYDLYAIRVVVNSTEDCYKALGYMHKLARPLPNRFKDFISFPKPNGYQSLHTTLAQLPGTPQDTFIEVQIRNKRMHREAKFGIAAHWSYKEYGATRHALERAQFKKMLSMQESIGEEEESSTLVDHIYVLTPKGGVVELPEGATPLDFAFQVHTDLGLAFHSAKINGSIVPLDHELENGDVVEVAKHKTPRPSPQWMQMLKMSSSRSKLRRHLHLQRRGEFITKGRELMNSDLQKRRLPILDSDLSLLRIYNGEVLPLTRREDILVKVGQGSQNAASVLPYLEALKGKEKLFEKNELRKTPPKQALKGKKVELEGGLPMPVRFAKGCSPDEGAKVDIIGIINRSGEVVIHKDGCKVVGQANPGKMIKAWWK